jgi:ABC-type nitrate/sulfonate/bicarbonate transport system substrate-binding protein
MQPSLMKKSAFTVVSFVRFFTLACLLIAFSALRASAAAPLTRVLMTTGAFSEREGVVFVAQDQSFFRRYGLDVRFVHVRSGPIGMAALSAGESQLHIGSVTGATLGAVAEGSDAVFVAGLINKLTGTIMVNSKIKTPVDLKGKALGVSSMSGGSWIFTMLALDHWGLEPKRDGITIRVVGDDSVRAQAIAAEVIDGAQLGYAFSAVLKSKGYRALADLAQLPIPYQSTGVLTRRSFIAASPETVEGVLKGLVDAIAFVQEPVNKAAVMKSLARWLRFANIEDAAEGYQSMTGLYERRIYPNVEGLRNVIRLLGAGSEKIRRIKAEDLVDDRFVRKLEKEGRF